jgi:hypothetical protein
MNTIRAGSRTRAALGIACASAFAALRAPTDTNVAAESGAFK